MLASFDAGEVNVALPITFQIIVIQRLEAEDIMFMPGEELQSFGKATGEEEIRNDNDDPAPSVPRLEFLARSGEICVVPEGGRLFQRAQIRQDIAPASTFRQNGIKFFCDRINAKLIQTMQGNVTKRRGELAGIEELRIHRRAAIQHDVNGRVLVDLEQFDNQVLEPGVNPPVNAAEIIAQRILRIISKSDAGPFLGGLAVGLKRSPEHLASQQIKAFQPADECRVGENHGGLVGVGVAGAGGAELNRSVHACTA